MLYKNNSLRKKVITPLKYIMEKLLYNLSYNNYQEFLKSKFDSNSKGNVAPITEFSNRKQIKEYFSKFNKIYIKIENIDSLYFPKTKICFPIKILLNNIARIFGTDFYIIAKK